MKKINIKIGLGILLVVLASGCSNNLLVNKSLESSANADETQPRGQILEISAIAEIAEETIELEVAQTQQQQAIGLMFRESLPDNRGMLFPFESERRATFWMKNVSIPLDMIFLNSDRVVGIAANVPPCKSEPCPIYGPDALVDKVIELRGGRTEELGLKSGDGISIKLLNTP
jgi:hypothetical protein